MVVMVARSAAKGNCRDGGGTQQGARFSGFKANAATVNSAKANDANTSLAAWAEPFVMATDMGVP